MDSNTRYTYENSGFNGFLNRGLSAKPAVTLRSLNRAVPRKEINFDQTQTSGSLGDNIQVGGIRLDGANRRIVIIDEAGNEVGWIGRLNG